MMNIILRKTDKGREEIATRKYGLSLRTRSILLVIDGRHSGQQLLEKFPGFAISEQLLASLLEQGFIDYAENEEQDAGKIIGNTVPAPHGVSGPDSSEADDAIAVTSSTLSGALPQADHTIASVLKKLAGLADEQPHTRSLLADQTSPAQPVPAPPTTGAASHRLPAVLPIEDAKTGTVQQDVGDEERSEEKFFQDARANPGQQLVSAPRGLTEFSKGPGVQELDDGTSASIAESAASKGSIQLPAEPSKLSTHPASGGGEAASSGQRISASRPDLDSLVAPDPVLLRIPGGIGSVDENAPLHDENAPLDSWSSGLPSYGEFEETLTPLQVIQYFYSRSITETLGDIGQTLRRRAAQAKSLEELRALRKPYLLAIAKIRGMETARRLCSELDQLLDMDNPPTPDQLLPGQ